MSKQGKVVQVQPTDKLEAIWLFTRFLKLVLKSIRQALILTVDEWSATYSKLGQYRPKTRLCADMETT